MTKWKNERTHQMGNISIHHDLKSDTTRIEKMVKLRKTQNLPYSIIAKRFNTHGSTVKRLIKQYEEKHE